MLAEREYDSALEALCMIDFHQLATNAKIVHIRLLGDTLDNLDDILKHLKRIHISIPSEDRPTILLSTLRTYRI